MTEPTRRRARERERERARALGEARRTPGARSGRLIVEVQPDLGAVDPAEWDALVPPDEPFTEHAFLHALEASGSVGPGSGWAPCHVLVREEGRLRAALPCYAKQHGWGEYIFDWGWADAAERAGIAYYPKLVAAVPFTPAAGRRFLTAPDAERGPLVDLLAAGARALADELDASSVHVLFGTAEERERLAAGHGWLARSTYQFHWEDRGWGSFAAFLGDFRAPARKNVRKERERAASAGLRFVTRRGPELTPQDWAALERFYRHTARRKGGMDYLRPAFFRALRERLPHRVVAALALDDQERAVAGTLSFQKGRHLYGRYWGALESHDALHFELCYYQPLESCFAHGWTRFEAGAQGEHKLKRGLLPVETCSAHWIRHPGLRAAVARHLDWERAAVREEMAALAEHGPFRREGDT